MMRSDGPLGDYGPFSFRNMLLVQIAIGVIGTIWTFSPWFPWK